MLVFLDESFRTHRRTGKKFGVLSGIAIPEVLFPIIQGDVFQIRKPFHDLVLKSGDELHGKELLGRATFKTREKQGYSYHWNLVEDLLLYCAAKKLRVFGVVCFRDDLQSFVCGDELRLDLTYRYLFERIDAYMKREFPGRFAKLIFDNRDHLTHEKNAKAITNFFGRSEVGLGYDSIVRVPFFAVSQGHNYGLQLADVITTVIGLRFQGETQIQPLWDIVNRMVYKASVGELKQSSLKVLRSRAGDEPDK